MTLMSQRKTPFERVMARVVIAEGGCWLYQGGLDRDGYGQIGVPREDGVWTTARAHRVVYEQVVGPIPEGMQLDHVRARGCQSRACCNPDHLEPVTALVNVNRGDTGKVNNANALKQACFRGHAFTPENTRLTRDGRRNCRQCRREKRMVNQ